MDHRAQDAPCDPAPPVWIGSIVNPLAATASALVDAVAQPIGIKPSVSETNHPNHGPTSSLATSTLLETGFPASRISKRARTGRGRPAPVYGAHKWWARRPPESVRALLIAAALPADAIEEFWRRFEDPEDTTWSEGRIADPFVGGGTSLVEAQRLGAAVYGLDVDPLAAAITEHELTHLDVVEFRAAADQLLDHLDPVVQRLYPAASTEESPLHYFYLRRVECTKCSAEGLLYKTLVLARDAAKQGGVVRDGQLAAYCPECEGIHMLPAARRQMECGGRRINLYKGTYSAGRYTCRACQATASHENLKTGSRPRVLVGVEVTRPGDHRIIRTPTVQEREQGWRDDAELAASYAALTLPQDKLERGLRERKPGIYGFDSFASLFSPRQLIVFGTAFRWLIEQPLSTRVKAALALAISNALSSNNLLCGFATDYGRLAPLFSVRDYSLPVLSVELNPLHETAGRGTLRATLRRVAASKTGTASHDTRDASVRVGDASAAVWADSGGFDVVMTDPPYFDYIAYSDLSQFFRVWLDHANLLQGSITGDPLYAGSASKLTFAERLGKSLQRVTSQLKDGGILVFTFHATTREGWWSAVQAIRNAGLVLTSAFPLWADGKSPGHGHAGNIEYDVVFCCRPAGRAQWSQVSVDDWAAMFGKKEVSTNDRAAWQLACEEINANPSEKGDR